MTGILGAPAGGPAAAARPPSRHPDRVRRSLPALAVGGTVLVSALALHLRDPHVPGSWGFCPFLVFTGAFCPVCGGLRAVNLLTHGDVAGAASSNLLVLAALPVAVLVWGRWLFRDWTGRAVRPLPSFLVTTAAWFTLVAGLVFWVLRNLPAGSWLAP